MALHHKPCPGYARPSQPSHRAILVHRYHVVQVSTRAQILAGYKPSIPCLICIAPGSQSYRQDDLETLAESVVQFNVFTLALIVGVSVGCHHERRPRLTDIRHQPVRIYSHTTSPFAIKEYKAICYLVFLREGQQIVIANTVLHLTATSGAWRLLGFAEPGSQARATT